MTGDNRSAVTGSQSPGLSRRRPPCLLAGVGGVMLVTLLAVVAVGTGAHYSQQLLPQRAGPALADPVTGAVGQLATVIILGGAELLLVLIVVFFPWGDFRHLGKATPMPVLMRRRDSLKLVGLAFGMLIALVVLLAIGLKRRKHPFHLAGPTAATSSPGHPGVAVGSIAVGSDLLAATAAVLVVLAGVGALLYLRARRNRHWRSLTAGMAPNASLAEELAPAMTSGLEELSQGRDPRSAVILAYLGLERTLGRNGLPRRRSETPLEYLERALQGMELNRTDLLRLTELYQAARYSDHPVDPSMRQQAEAALRSLRDQLLGRGSVPQLLSTPSGE